MINANRVPLKAGGFGLCLLSGLLVCPMSGLAANCTVSASPTGCPIQVQAKIENGCSVSGGTGTAQFGNVTFGTRPSLATGTANAALVASGVFLLNCTPDMSLTVSIDGGLHYSANRRVQQSNGTAMVYRLYSDAALQSQIGVNQAFSLPITGANNSNITLPVYAQLSLPGNLKPGSYTDTLTVTLSW